MKWSQSDIVRNAKVISDLAWEIIGDTTKTKEDVSSTYHRIVENFKWNSESESGSESSDNDDNKGQLISEWNFGVFKSSKNPTKF